MKTIGISPKVAIPALLTLAVGIFLYLTGEHETGLALILTAVGAGGIGYVAPPAPTAVVGNVGPASDDLLPPSVQKKLRADD